MSVSTNPLSFTFFNNSFLDFLIMDTPNSQADNDTPTTPDTAIADANQNTDNHKETLIHDAFVPNFELPPVTESKRKKDGTARMTREERAARKAARQNGETIDPVRPEPDSATAKQSQDAALALMSVTMLDSIAALVSSGEAPAKTKNERLIMQNAFADYYATIDSTPPAWLVLIGASGAYLSPAFTTAPALSRLSRVKMWVLRKLGV